MDSRRRIFTIGADLLVIWLTGHDAVKVTSDMPEDAKIVGCGWDETRNMVRLAVESESFDEIPDGYFAPDFTPAYTTHHMSDFEAAMKILLPDVPTVT